VNVTGISLAGGSGRKADEVLAGIEADIAPACLRRRLIAEMVRDVRKEKNGLLYGEGRACGLM
jgi:hypothetical protein